MRLFKIILINFFILFLILFLFEMGLHIYYCHKFPVRKYNAYIDNMRQFDKYYSDWLVDWKRKPLGLNFKKKSILLFGGSFAHSSSLSDKQTFSYKLSQRLQRPVYNYSLSGGCATHMLYMLQDSKIYKDVTEPEYVIYLWTDDEMSRLYRYMEILPSNDFYPRYVIKNGNLHFVKTDNFYNKFWSLYIVRLFQQNLIEENLVKNKKQTFALMRAILNESRKEINKHWNTKRFIIFKYRIYWPDREGYPNCGGEFTDLDDEWEKLRQDGFEIIDMQDLTGISMCNQNYVISLTNYHPNEKAWDKLVPLFADKIDK